MPVWGLAQAPNKLQLGAIKWQSSLVLMTGSHLHRNREASAQTPPLFPGYEKNHSRKAKKRRVLQTCCKHVTSACMVCTSAIWFTFDCSRRPVVRRCSSSSSSCKPYVCTPVVKTRPDLNWSVAMLVGTLEHLPVSQNGLCIGQGAACGSGLSSTRLHGGRRAGVKRGLTQIPITVSKDAVLT